ncbi:substrate-binding domain-containing protein [Cellulomonas sp. 179-A 4D5 NHS]|uniref:substrate-binding domain-containing protein n=1 Tax=Cellulomonas sp. 179-A 4D5 NHS TaxID=3142378 RepID=UPI0039A20FD3
MGTIRRGPVAASARRTIGVLSPVVGGFYFGGLIAGVSRAARTSGHRVVAVQTYPAGLDRERYPDEPLLEVPVALGAVDGIIIIAKAVRHDRLASVQEWGRPVVMISEDETQLPAPVVVPDNAGGVCAAVEHLLEHGHTRISFVGNLAQRDIRERYEAYRDTLAEHGVEPDPEWFYETVDNHEQGGADAAARFLAAGVPTTATVAATDRNAIGFLRALRASGLVLPRDQAVVGFDHTESGARLVPRLSTVDPHNDRVGELAVKLLLARLRGEEVATGAHRAPATLVTRESCGCGEPSATPDACHDDGALDTYGSTPARARLRRLSDTGFAGPSAAAGTRRAGDEARTSWLHAVVDPIAAAAERGSAPSGVALGRLADLTSALQPHPEALEQLVSAVRDLESELMGALPPTSDRLPVLRRVTTEVLLTLTKGCTRPMLARSGYLERTIADQYEVDMDLLRGKGPSPRALTWLPRAVRGPACLGLWVGHERSPGDREIEIVGVNDTSGTLSRLIGLRTPASQFPPPALTRAGTIGSTELTFVIPVTFGGSDWGLLAIDGNVETRMTSARDKYNHWAALLAVALDQERLVASLRDQRRALEQAAARERALADTVRASEERYALASMAAQDGTWDWDVSAGTVYYSPRWKQTLGYEEDEIGASPTEWLERVHPDDRDELSASIAAQLGGARTPLELEHRVRTSSGDYRWMMCRAVTVLDDAGCPARLVGALVDMTERKEQELALRRNALRDPETGLANRMLFLDRLGAAIKRTRRSGDFDCTVVLLRVVAEPGHPLRDDGTELGDGDVEVRREVVRRLRRALHEGDSAARLGQDEFAVLLDDVGAGGDPVRVEELLTHVRTDLGVDVAVGVLSSIQRFNDADDALREADIALLRAQTQPDPRRRSTVR